MKIKFASFLLALAMAPAVHASYSDAPVSAQSSMEEMSRPRGPGRGPGYPGRPGPRGRWECASQNARGRRFLGVDFNRNWAQREAQNRCLRNSRICRPIGCRAVR